MQRWGTCLPNLGTLGLWVLELFAMHATDGRTDGRTKARLIAYGGEGHNTLSRAVIRPRSRSNSRPPIGRAKRTNDVSRGR